ncbi:hypothetical protein JCM10550A_02960 [Methanogenium cariaci]
MNQYHVLNDIYISEGIVRAVGIETTMKRLLHEIESTKRRVNALEFKVIPELKEATAFITMQPDEIERNEKVRLKKIKAKSRAWSLFLFHKIYPVGNECLIQWSVKKYRCLFCPCFFWESLSQQAVAVLKLVQRQNRSEILI